MISWINKKLKPVNDFMKDFAAGMAQADIWRKYNVKQPTGWKIVHGERWVDV